MALRRPNATTRTRLSIRFQDALEAANRRQINAFTQQRARCSAPFEAPANDKPLQD